MPWLLLLFVVLPAVELALLIEVGSRIGTASTLGLIAATGVVGAALARRQGLQVLQRLQHETQAGQMPAGPLLDGVLILVAGALLVTPGILTDAFGFLCLVPAFRRLVKAGMRRRLERAIREGRAHVHVWRPDAQPPREEKVVYDLSGDEDDSPRPPRLH